MENCEPWIQNRQVLLFHQENSERGKLFHLSHNVLNKKSVKLSLMHTYQLHLQSKYLSNFPLYIYNYRTESLIMREGEDPAVVADKFAKKYNLGEPVKQILIG